MRRILLRGTQECSALRQRCSQSVSTPRTCLSSRGFHIDGRDRLSAIWVPSAKEANVDPQNEDALSLLVKAGFLNHAYSGVFHLLPLGLRVQDKIEHLVDYRMRSLGASKLALSSITHATLWQKSGRLQGDNGELTKLATRAGDGFFLAPTHEEEITNIVGSLVKNAKWLPLRLYQISRKYRDERRPRQGLLRTREFLMKDLYTFDLNDTDALLTYEQVKRAYSSLFASLNIPFHVAEADSGSIGGNYSHEFHFVTDIGEDNLISCSHCDYVANEELARRHVDHAQQLDPSRVTCHYELADGGNTLVEVFLPPACTRDEVARKGRINPHALKRVVPNVLSGVTDALETLRAKLSTSKQPRLKLLRVFDSSLSPADLSFPDLPSDISKHFMSIDAISAVDASESIRSDLANLRAIESSDACPKCHAASLRIDKAVELGHTFHLGTRYSQPLGAVVTSPSNQKEVIPISMGCHGIGISRMIGAVASMLKDSKGLNWPRIIAPWQVVIVPGDKVSEEDITRVYDALSAASGEHKGTIEKPPSSERLDVVIDDRTQASFVGKLKDADLLGFPVIVVMGSRWAKQKQVEVQKRRTGEKVFTSIERLGEVVEQIMRN